MKIIKLTFFVILFAFAVQGVAQEYPITKPDYQEIKNSISDKNSKFYYPVLLQRLNAFDPSLTTEEYRYLYYGFLFQPGFQNANDDKMQKFYNWNSEVAFTENDIADLVITAKEVIAENPFNLRATNMLREALRYQGDSLTANKIWNRYVKTMDAILSSGHGQSCESSFHVINANHEYMLLHFFSLKAIEQSVVDGNCDMLSLETNNKGISALYFQLSNPENNDVSSSNDVKVARKPDYNQIQQGITDKNSQYYYPNLLKRMLEFDQTLTQADYRHLYYGYIFQEEYQPELAYNDDKLQKYYNRDADIPYSESEIQELIALTGEAIKYNPFDLRALTMYNYGYYLKGDTQFSEKIVDRILGALDAIVSSGNGQDCETGYHVISISHQSVLTDYYKLEVSSHTKLDDKCDLLTFEPNESKIEAIFFDISKISARNKELGM